MSMAPKVMTATALAIGVATTVGTSHAHAGLLGKWADKVTPELDHSIDFRNNSDETIVVVMDSGRDRERIAPGGQGTLEEANIGDNPTLTVKDPDTGATLYSERIGVRTNGHSSYGWNGNKF